MTAGAHFALPEADGIYLCKVLGLAISNISMYGIEHSVTATSVAQAFDALVAKTDLYGAIEFVTGEGGLMVNGSPVETARTTGQLLMDQLMKLDVHDFEFQPPVSHGDFNQFMTILAAAPGSLAVSDGFETAMAKAKLKSVRVSGVSYTRVDKNAPPPPPPSTRRTSSAGGSRSFDLDIEMGIEELGAGDAAAAGIPASGLSFAATAYVEQKRAADAERQKLLELIRTQGSSLEGRRALREQLFGAGVTREEWNDLLLASGAALPDELHGGTAVETLQRLLMDVDVLASQGTAIAAGQSSEAMDNILQAISLEVARLVTETQGQADTLAEKVDSDRQTVAQLEAEARARGIGLNLSRDELLASLAEINQELAQPLTAASAVIDVLEEGKLGAVTEAQHDVLHVASDGMKRLGKLVAYLSTISGMPEALSPDREILDDAYGE